MTDVANDFLAQLEAAEDSNRDLTAKLTEAERRLCEDTHAPNTLEWRQMVDALRTELAEATAREVSLADAANQLSRELAGVKAVARQLLEAIGKMANCYEARAFRDAELALGTLTEVQP